MAPLRRRLLACLPGLAALAAGADETPVLRAAVFHITPFGMVDAQGRYSGIFYDLMLMLAEECQLRFETTVVPYPRAMAMLAAGDTDLLMGIANAQILREALPVAFVSNNEVLVIGRAGLRLASLHDLHGKTVAQIRGTDYGHAFMSDGAIRHYETSNQLQSMKMLHERRVDALIGTRIAVFQAMRELGIRREQLSASLRVQDTDMSLFLSRRRNEPALVDQLRKGVQALRAQGRVTATYARYAGGLPLS
jgi:polar amino acid transport system substrate-binding protein